MSTSVFLRDLTRRTIRATLEVCESAIFMQTTNGHAHWQLISQIGDWLH